MMGVKSGQKITAVQGRGLTVRAEDLPQGEMAFCLSIPGNDGQCYVRSTTGERSVSGVTVFRVPASHIDMLGPGWHWHIIDVAGTALTTGVMEVLPGVCDGVLPPPEPPVIAVIEGKIADHDTDTEAHADIREAIMGAINQLPQAVNLRNLDDAQSYIAGIIAALKSVSLVLFFALVSHSAPVRFGGIDRDALVETNGITRAQAQEMIDMAPAYWPPDATPSQYFSFDTNNNAITITGYDEAGGTDVRIPNYINGWPVKVIGDGVFQESDIESVHGDVVTIGDEAFAGCPSLITASFPQATTICERAFVGCAALTTAPFPQATTIGTYAFAYCDSLVDITLGTDAANFNVIAFAYINANPTITISNPHAKGWGETFAGLAVVRPEITADAFTLNGDTITEWPEGGGGFDGFGDWQTFSSASATPTLTVTGYQPIRATLTGGDVTLTVTGLDSPFPVYVTIQGADSLTIASAQWVGGAFYDTASVNHYIVWTAGGALFCQPVATTEVQ